MGQYVYQLRQITDKEIFDAFEIIAEESGVGASYRFTAGGKNLTIEFDEALPPATLKVLQFDTQYFNAISLHTKNMGDSYCQVVRDQSKTKCIIEYRSLEKGSIQDAKFLASCQQHFKKFILTADYDKILGPELAEFYNKREEALIFLEDRIQQLMEHHENHRVKVDTQYQKKEAALHTNYETKHEELEAQHTAKQEELEAEYSKRAQELEQRETQLEARAQELDDRDNRHARRATREEMKKELAMRSRKFSLTEETQKKRWPIHALFVTLILVAVIILGNTLDARFSSFTWTRDWLSILRVVIASATALGAIFFYIRWNDKWFHQHADEEFRLKRLELDIDRASWVVEMALEWKEEKGTEIPPELLDRLTRNLFVESGPSDVVRHPNEDLASRLLGAASTFRVDTPGGQVELNRSGINKFDKATK